MKNLKQEQILELCKYLGFESQLIYMYPYKHSTDSKENLRYLLWLTEISDWLLQTYGFELYLENNPLNICSLEYIILEELKGLKEEKEYEKNGLLLL